MKLLAILFQLNRLALGFYVGCLLPLSISAKVTSRQRSYQCVASLSCKPTKHSSGRATPTVWL